MTTAKTEKYRFVGAHAEEIVPGQFTGPGEEVSLNADQLKDDNVKRLLDEGQLLEIESGKKEASK
jgi:hypothetical protein